MSASSIVLRDLRRSFGAGETAVSVLRGVDLTVGAGQFVALYGPSGSGKTTLLNLVGGLDRPSSGTVEVLGQAMGSLSEGTQAKFRRTHIGFIFQSYTLLPIYSALENIDLALRLPGFGLRERRARAKAALEAVGLSAWADHVPAELSGGQQQRVAIARALALRPKVLLADEPTSGLDTRTTRRTLTLFRSIAAAEGTTFLIATHDPLIAEFADATYDLLDGMIAARNTLAPNPFAASGSGQRNTPARFRPQGEG